MDLGDARDREREALHEASRQVLICCAHAASLTDGADQQAALDPAHEAIRAYGRAVREADKEAIDAALAVHCSDSDPVVGVEQYDIGVVDGHRCARRLAAAAIEALKEKP